MNYEISVKNTAPIDFNPATEAEEILQNICYILSTIKYSVPLDRELGIDASFVDTPTETAKAKMASEIVMAIAKYEPRATVTNIYWSANIDGKLEAKVQVRIDEP
ncbi:MAG: GPW/gp25 family protein [Phascolarctobacterium sp.]|nr:GPW/gp25 family protein [Phascolarctobacterium sp.]